ncbi:MAG: hypothetical protein RL226_2273, partial [Bacteroidota bacterium]
MRYFFFFAILISACSPDTQGDVVTPSASEPQSTVTKPQASGQLFIIGGGKLHVPLMQAMVEEGGIAKTDLIVVIPAASEEPDTAIYYDSMPFLEMGYTNVKPLRLSAADSLGGTRVDSLMMAKGIFLCGGDQSRLMAVIGQPKILGKLHEAYREGAVIGGTSAGAAVMSAIMITGDQKKEPDYESTYRRLKTNNGMYAQGTGLFANGIID